MDSKHLQVQPVTDCSVFRMQLSCLLAMGVLEFLFITAQTLFGWVFFYCTETFLILPSLLFLGISLTRELTVQAKRQLLLCLGMVVWFVIVQIIHRAQGMSTQSIVLFFGVYLMPFPFAAITRDGVQQKGLKRVAWIYIAASLALVVYTALLQLNQLPSALIPYVTWDGARLRAVMHPNVCACLFMIGIALCLGFFFHAGKVWQKGLLLLAVALQFVCLALTNCRTSILMTCGLIGSIPFFALVRGGWKRAAAGLAAALVLIPSLFIASSSLFQLHNAHLIAQYSQAAPLEETSAASDEKAAASDGETAAPAAAEQPKLNNAGQLQGVSGQQSLSSDLRTLNGRTTIWLAAIKALRNQPTILIWGTDNPGAAISYFHSDFIEHGHNSWVEVLLRFGLPGLLVSLILTAAAVWDALFLLWKSKDMWKTCIALLVLCLLVAGFLEPFFFSAIVFYHFFDFFLFLLIGYMTQWCKEDSCGI